VTVFFLEGGRPTFGPRAAELTGEFYKNLWEHDYFGVKNQEATSTPAVAHQPSAAFPSTAPVSPFEQ
jgi:hypothetical protein